MVALIFILLFMLAILNWILNSSYPKFMAEDSAKLSYALVQM